MPIIQKWHFVCPITGGEVVSSTPNMPDRWGNVNGETFSPEGIWIIAQRVVSHPDAEYSLITTSPYPDAVLDSPLPSEG